MSGWIMAATAAMLASRAKSVAVKGDRSLDATAPVIAKDEPPPLTRQQRRAMERRVRKTGGDR